MRMTQDHEDDDGGAITLRLPSTPLPFFFCLLSWVKHSTSSIMSADSDSDTKPHMEVMKPGQKYATPTPVSRRHSLGLEAG